MAHDDFDHLLGSIKSLSPEQMRRLQRELEREMAAAQKRPAVVDLGSLGAMRDAADELDEAVEHAMSLRQRPWRLSHGE
jgi:hypothetical protein